MEFWYNMGAEKYIIAGVIVIMALYSICTVFYLKAKQKKNTMWIEENPNAVKVYIKQKMGTLTILSVDNENARTFNEGSKFGIYLNPGEHIIESSYLKTRPGIMHKMVTTTYGPSKQRIMVERNKVYEYTFETRGEHFTFSERGALEKLQREAVILLDDVKKNKEIYGHIYNYIKIDAIDGNPLEAFPFEESSKKKGLLASKIEIIYLKPGEHKIKAHGVTYQKTPVEVRINIDEGKYYCLGANEEAVYIDERPYEWILDK